VCEPEGGAAFANAAGYNKSMNAFKILSDPIRYRIVEILASGEHMSGELSEAVIGNYGVSRAAVSKHLAILRDAGWVDYREDASARWYHLTHEVWESVDVSVQWFRYLWARRIGYFSNNDNDNDTDPRLASTASPWPMHTEEP